MTECWGANSFPPFALPPPSRRERLLGNLRLRAALVHQPVELVAGRVLTIGRQRVVSFVSASYLGLEQDPRVLRAVGRAIARLGLSLGTPRLLASDPLTRRLERALAHFTAQPAAAVFPSTSHCALDVIPLLAGSRGALFVDRWAYPTQRDGIWGAERRGARVHWFEHNQPAALARALRSSGGSRARLVVCDGVYAAGGQQAPLRRFAQIAAHFGALLYVDDSHGLGVLGPGSTNAADSYGRGGGGLLRAAGPFAAPVLLVGTLSKALGVPIAFAAGPSALIGRIKLASQSAVHSSPPSVASAAAALEALSVQARDGDLRRAHLARLVRLFRQEMRVAGIEASSAGLFPVQTVPFQRAAEAVRVAACLRRAGIWPALQLRPPDQPGREAVLRFFLTALHTPRQVQQAVRALASCLAEPS